MNLNRANKIWFIGLGILAMSFASILIKLCDAPALVIAAYRLAIAAAFYTLWVMADKHKNRRQLANLPWKALLMAVCFWPCTLPPGLPPWHRLRWQALWCWCSCRPFLSPSAAFSFCRKK
jgi:hypothetical protein